MVAAILALLAAVVVPQLIKSSGKALVNLCKAQVARNGNIARALKQYRFEIGRYPDTDEGLLALYEIPDSVDEESGRWNGAYLEGDIEDLEDPWGQEYEYKSPGEFHEDAFDLWSIGPDGEDGTEDDVKNWRET